MQRNDSIVSLRPPTASQRVMVASAETEASYGCVDWYLYQSSPPVQPTPVITNAAVAAPCSSIIERTAAAAGAAVSAVNCIVSAAEAGAW